LIAEKLIEIEVIDEISLTSVTAVLKKANVNLCIKKDGAFLKKNTSFVAAMEDVLEVYQRPKDPLRSLVCLGESTKQLLSETRNSRPPSPGNLAKYDSQYVRV
jgi:hypothetical protein